MRDWWLRWVTVGIIDEGLTKRRLLAMKDDAEWSRRRSAMVAAVVALGVVVGMLPWGAVASGAPAEAAASQPAKATNDFPFVVAFEKGLTTLEKGDAITITEIRGTSKDMNGGIYRITGTYVLASKERATLAGSVTAKDAADAKGPWNPAQQLAITKGGGTFTLLLPVSIQGWPHVSFYGNGGSFGGIYVGTGDSVLKHF
jgi:hypothetical protein